MISSVSGETTKIINVFKTYFHTVACIQKEVKKNGSKMVICNFTHFKMLFSTMVMDFILLVYRSKFCLQLESSIGSVADVLSTEDCCFVIKHGSYTVAARGTLQCPSKPSTRSSLPLPRNWLQRSRIRSEPRTLLYFKYNIPSMSSRSLSDLQGEPYSISDTIQLHSIFLMKINVFTYNTNLYVGVDQFLFQN